MRNAFELLMRRPEPAKKTKKKSDRSETSSCDDVVVVDGDEDDRADPKKRKAAPVAVNESKKAKTHPMFLSKEERQLLKAVEMEKKIEEERVNARKLASSIYDGSKVNPFFLRDYSSATRTAEMSNTAHVERVLLPAPFPRVSHVTQLSQFACAEFNSSWQRVTEQTVLHEPERISLMNLMTKREESSLSTVTGMCYIIKQDSLIPALQSLLDLDKDQMVVFEPYLYSIQTGFQLKSPNLLTELHRPRSGPHSLAYLRNKAAVENLTLWLSSFNRKKKTSKLRKKKRIQLSDSEDSASTDVTTDVPNSDSDFQSPIQRKKQRPMQLNSSKLNTRCIQSKAVLLHSEKPAAKTATIFALAEQLGYQVIEVHPGSGRRSGSDLLQLVGETTKTHSVHRKAETSFFDFKSKKKQVVDDGEEDIKRKQRSLILLEEVDILFEEDNGFWKAVLKLMDETRRPIIMTCNDLSNIPQEIIQLSETTDDFGAKLLRKIFMKQPSENDLAIFLFLVALQRGYWLETTSLEHFVRHIQGDVRKALMELDLILKMHFPKEITKRKRALTLDDCEEAVILDETADASSDDLVFHELVLNFEEKNSIKSNFTDDTSELTKIDSLFSTRSHLDYVHDYNDLHLYDVEQMMPETVEKQKFSANDYPEILDINKQVCDKILYQDYYPALRHILQAHRNKTSAEHMETQEAVGRIRRSTRWMESSRHIPMSYFPCVHYEKEGKLLKELSFPKPFKRQPSPILTKLRALLQ